MLRRKLPDEIFAGRRTLPHQLFGRDAVASYLTNVERGPRHRRRRARRRRCTSTCSPSPGASGTGSGWRHGAAPAQPRVSASSASPPPSTRWTARSPSCTPTPWRPWPPSGSPPASRAGRHRHRARLHAGRAPRGRGRARPVRPGGGGVGRRRRRRRRGRARRGCGVGRGPDPRGVDVQPLRRAGVMLVDLLAHADELDRVHAGERPGRGVHARVDAPGPALDHGPLRARPVIVDVGDAVHEVSPGATVATLLPLANTQRRPRARPGTRPMEPATAGRHLGAGRAVEFVTVFGHGRHTCPAQPFSLSAMTAAATRFSAASTWSQLGRPPVPVGPRSGAWPGPRALSGRLPAPLNLRSRGSVVEADVGAAGRDGGLGGDRRRAEVVDQKVARSRLKPLRTTMRRTATASRAGGMV